MKWEYRTVVFYAKAHEPETREYLRSIWPGWEPPRSAPQALIPKLNEIGSRGWELVSIQPVYLDEDANVLVHGGPNPASGRRHHRDDQGEGKNTHLEPRPGAHAIHERLLLRLQAAGRGDPVIQKGTRSSEAPAGEEGGFSS